MQDKINFQTFVEQLYWMNRDEREAVGVAGFPSADAYYRANKPFIDIQWRLYEETGKHLLLEKNNL